MLVFGGTIIAFDTTREIWLIVEVHYTWIWARSFNGETLKTFIIDLGRSN